jgi:hypothetical protein
VTLVDPGYYSLHFILSCLLSSPLFFPHPYAPPSVTVSIPRIQSPPTSIHITAGTATQFTYQLFDDRDSLRIFVTPEDSPNAIIYLPNDASIQNKFQRKGTNIALIGVNITVLTSFDYESNKTFSFNYTPTQPGIMSVFGSNFTIVPSMFPILSIFSIPCFYYQLQLQCPLTQQRTLQQP